MTVGEEKNYLLENMAMMLSSGMTVLDALSAARKEVRRRAMRLVLDDLISDISAGMFVWKALDRTGLFPGYVISLIKTGEEGGNLPENLHVVAAQQTKERVFSSKLRSAMMYPGLFFL